MKNLRLIALAAMLLPLTACSSSSSPDQVSVALTMGESVPALRPFTSTMDGNAVTVLGAIATPNPCYNFAAVVAKTDNVIEATVKADTKGGVCTGVFMPQNYTLIVNGVPKGTWTLRVTHAVDGKTALLQYETTVSVK